MSLSRVVLGWMLALAGPPAVSAGGKDAPAEPPDELTSAPYDSATRGALQVRTVSEKTGEWFQVTKGGKGGAPAGQRLLNKTLELDPGEYVVIVNRTERVVKVEAGKKAVLWAGEVVVEGEKVRGDFYAPFQGKDKKLASAEPLLNKPTALFAGKYTVKCWGAETKDLGEAEVKPGQRTVLKR